MNTRTALAGAAFAAIAAVAAPSAQRPINPDPRGAETQAAAPADPSQAVPPPQSVGRQAGPPMGPRRGGGPNGGAMINGQAGGRAGRGGARPGGPPDAPGIRLVRLLNLTPEQRASFARITLDARDASAGPNDQARELRSELHRAAFADTRDGAKIADLETKIAALDKQLLEIRVKSEGDLSAILTPEQRKQARVAEPMGPPLAGARSGRGR